VREKLLLGPGETVLVIRKVFLADGRPAIYCVDYIPRQLIAKPFTRDDLAPQVFSFLEQFAGERVVYYVADLVPTVAEGDTAQRLECSLGAPLLLFDEVAYNIEDKPILCCLVHHRQESLRLRIVQSRT